MTALAALALAGGIHAAPAFGAWTPPVNLSTAGEDATDARLAADADGEMLFTWERSDGANTRIQVRERSAAGVLGTIRNVSPAGEDAFDPQLAMGADGGAVFTWDNGTNGRIQLRARSASGVLGPVENLSAAGTDGTDPQIAIDGDGDAVVVWENPVTGGVKARARSAAGVLGPVQTISPDGIDPKVAIDADGDAAFTWLRTSNFRVRARTRSAAGTLGPTITLSAPAPIADRPTVAIEADGDAIFVWQRWDGSADDCCYRVQARTRTAAGDLGQTRTLSRAGSSAADPSVGIDADGDAVFAWQRHDGSNFRAQARARSAAGVLAQTQTVSPAGQTVFVDPPGVAVEPDGDAVLTWLNFTIGQVQARSRSAAGALGPVETLSGLGAGAEQHRVAVSGDGDAAVIWRGFDGTNNRIQAAFGP